MMGLRCEMCAGCPGLHRAGDHSRLVPKLGSAQADRYPIRETVPSSLASPDSRACRTGERQPAARLTSSGMGCRLQLACIRPSAVGCYASSMSGRKGVSATSLVLSSPSTGARCTFEPPDVRAWAFARTIAIALSTSA